MHKFKLLGYSITVERLVILSAVAAVYVAVTLALGGLSYANIQFRVSEALVMLCFYKKAYCVSMVVGCFIANIASTVGIVDMVVGTFATLVAVLGICVCSRFLPGAFEKSGMSEYKAHILSLVIASLCPVVANAILVGLELYIFVDLPLFISMLEVAAGELVCVSIIGTVMFLCLEKNKQFMKIITQV